MLNSQQLFSSEGKQRNAHKQNLKSHQAAQLEGAADVPQVADHEAVALFENIQIVSSCSSSLSLLARMPSCLYKIYRADKHGRISVQCTATSPQLLERQSATTVWYVYDQLT